MVFGNFTLGFQWYPLPGELEMGDWFVEAFSERAAGLPSMGSFSAFNWALLIPHPYYVVGPTTLRDCVLSLAG